MIAVTGATGFVGRELMRQGLSLPITLRALVRAPVQIPGISDIRVVGALNDPLPSDALTGCQVVIHCAARVHVMQETDVNPEWAFLRANSEAAVATAESAAAAGVQRFVFVSSIKVLGERTLPGAPFLPEDSPGPTDAYARSKAAAERELKALATRTGMELVIVRAPLVHGVGAKGNLGTLVWALQRGFPLPLAAIENRRSLVHVENLAGLLLEAATHPNAPSQTFHVADEDALSTPEIVRAVASGLGVEPHLFSVPPSLLRGVGRLAGRGSMVGRLVDSLEVDASKTASLLSWRPHITTREGLRRMGAAAR